MEVQTINDLIMNNGVAIAMLIYLIWDKRSVEEKQNQKLDTLTTALNNNTVVISNLKAIFTSHE